MDFMLFQTCFTLMVLLFFIRNVCASPTEKEAAGSINDLVIAEIMRELSEAEKEVPHPLEEEERDESANKLMESRISRGPDNSPWLPAKATLVQEHVEYHETEEGELKPTTTANIMQAGGCDCHVLIYDEPNYQGRPLHLSQQNANFLNDFFNDRVESIQLGGNCQWLFYEHINFLGKTHLLSVDYYASAPKWGGRRNQISSARALPPEDTVIICLFQHVNYQGRMLLLYGSLPSLPVVDFNDHISSVIIIGGEWRLFEHTNFMGRSIGLGKGEYPSLHQFHFHIGRNSISSVQLQQNY